jgi:hypothetical protein
MTENRLGVSVTITVTITRSGGIDGAVVVFIDTEFEPDGSDEGPGLRVCINDDDAYVGVPFIPNPDDL